MSFEISEKLMHEAIDRIARTPDGRVLYLYCQRRLMALTVSADLSTLQSDHGERTFAARLISLMATGISESGGRTSSGGPGSISEQPIVFAVPKPRAVGGPRGAGRRIDEHTRVPGYDPPDSDDAA
jgi:hypothetical protein